MSTLGLRSSTSKSTRNGSKPQQARDNVRDMLVNKMMAKYGKMPNASTVIASRVTKFMQQSRVTEANLKKLEKEILEILSAKPQSVAPAKESPKMPPKEASQPRPISSVSKKSEQAPQVVTSGTKYDYENSEFGEDSEFGLEKRRVPYNEDKEWDAILKFNNDLYKEELRQEEEKKAKQKLIMKAELDRQLQEKRKITQQEQEELHAYEGLQKTHLDIMSAKDKEKVFEQKKQKLTAKEMLDKQLKDEYARKHRLELENKEYEKALVEKAKKELEAEKMALQQKKEMERAYHKRMMEENEANKKKQLEQEQLLREQEKRDLSEYTRILDQQEANRLEMIKTREKKTQNLMNRMADTVIKEMDRKKEEDDLKMLRYQQEKEFRDKLDEEERLRRAKEMQKEMRQQLDQQMNEKKDRASMEKEDSKRQAEVWKKELVLFHEEEKIVKQKVASVNKGHAEFLKRQMEESKKGKKGVMNREEYLMNKRIIEEAERKSKSGTPLTVQDSQQFLMFNLNFSLIL
eukprot:TRINITY_DN1683_c0_g1_i1.p2 TRINITY_DN1683_c0_g1~~TRINITY_DN1683_c0_g1_i1.p2  ORF type:complete len:518 (-),score=129.22 TRINITY_DN1683_c0_g1_i1:3209-4762(-)